MARHTVKRGGTSRSHGKAYRWDQSNGKAKPLEVFYTQRKDSPGMACCLACKFVVPVNPSGTLAAHRVGRQWRDATICTLPKVDRCTVPASDWQHACIRCGHAIRQEFDGQWVSRYPSHSQYCPCRGYHRPRPATLDDLQRWHI